ncbi:MAG: InlB B-repeat-containing protein, partial [Chitinispirillales bacterium]|nr:InlB B-repeat-containing protein [Chitinispirillales bacterium]
MQNKNKFLKVAAVIAAVCVAGNTADYVENRKLLSKGDSVVSAYPAIVEVYALGGGGGGEGGHRKNYCGSDYYIGTGSSGGGGGAIYAKLRVPKGLSIKIFDIGAGGTPGKYRFEGCGSSWNTGGDGGHGGNTVVTIGGNDILRIDGGGAHGGGTEVGGQNSNGGGSGGCVAIRNNSSEITLIDNVFSCGYRGDNGADWQITNAAGGNSGQIPGGKGIRTEVFGGGSGAKRIENSNEVVAAGIGGGGHGGYWDWGAAAGGRGEAIVYITYLWNVTFNSNGGSPNPSSISEIYNGRKIGEPSKPAKTGYIFDGWYKNAECTDANRWDFNNSGVTGDMTLYAKWTKEEYYITYDLNGGINHASNPLIYNVETPTITLQSPTREHFTFGGWFDNAELSGTTVTLIPNGSTWNKTYYAKWVAIPFTVSFDTKGGSPTPPQVIVNSGNLVDKPNDPTRLHHEFLGWFIDLDSDIQWSFVNNTVTKDI